MKPLIIFFILAVYILAAFSWLTYSSIKNSRQMKETEEALLWSEIFKANADIVNQISSYNLEDSTSVKEYARKKYPQYQLFYVPQSESFEEYAMTPTDAALKQIDDRMKSKIQMYISEGIVFVFLLLWGLWWIYRSFSQRIEVNKQQQNFLLAVTHELKTPIAAVKLYLQTLQKRQLDKEQTARILENSVRETERLNDLVENVLVATQLEGKSYHYHFEKLELSPLLQEALDKIKAVFADKIQWDLHLQPELYINGDKTALLAVMSNLLENAAKYSAQGTRVKLSLEEGLGGNILVKIQDEGIGIPQGELKKIFKKFYRVGNEQTRKSKGTGLGLFIVRQVLDRHHANIEVESVENKGSLFTVKFSSYGK